MYALNESVGKLLYYFALKGPDPVNFILLRNNEAAGIAL